VIAQNKNTPYYGISLNLQKDTTITLTYTLDPTIVYYAKYYDICNGSTAGTAFAQESSLGHSDYLGSNSYAITEMELTEEGYYNVTLAGGNRYTGSTETVTLLYEDDDEEAAVGEYAAGEYRVVTIDSVKISAGQELMISNSTSNDYFAGDYIIVRKAVETSVAKSITAGGYATFASEYAVSIPDGITAYYITADGINLETNKISMTKITATTIPANTGIVIEGTAGDYEFPIVKSSDTEISGNLMKVADGSSECGENCYGISKTKGIFVKLKSSAVLSKGKAYLDVSTVSSAKFGNELIIANDNVNAINEVNAAVKSGKIYNLQGIEVKNASNGLYIVNGKKVIK